MKRYLSTLFFTLVPFTIGMFTAYLVGSFVSVSLDPSLWSPDARLVTAVGGALWGSALYVKLQFEGLV